MNHCILIGRLGRDPETTYGASGTAIVKFSLATSEKYKGEEKTEWHRCVAFGATGENLAKFFTKGDGIAVTGKIQYGQYEKDGRTVYTTDIIVNRWEFLPGVSKKSEGGAANVPAENGGGGVVEDDIPF